MFWQANKGGILILIFGSAVLASLYAYAAPTDKALAERILSTGICLLLFIVALGSFLSAKKGNRR